MEDNDVGKTVTGGWVYTSYMEEGCAKLKVHTSRASYLFDLDTGSIVQQIQILDASVPM
jgi:hypothetical protein